MRVLARLRQQLWGLLHRQHAEAEMIAELQLHLQQLVSEKVAAGLSVDAAEREARLQFGNLESLKERCRAVWLPNALEEWLRNLQIGFRMIIKYPLLNLATGSSIVILTIVTCTAAAILQATLRPALPYIDSKQLVTVVQRSRDGIPTAFSYSGFLSFKAQASAFADVAAQSARTYVVSLASFRGKVDACVVSDNFLQVLGTHVRYGRNFSAQDQPELAMPECIVTYQFAASHCKSPPDAVGQTMVVDDRRYQIVGVLPKGFRFISNADLLLPLNSRSPPNNDSDRSGLYCIARVGPRLAMAAVKAKLDQAARIVGEQTGSAISGAVVRPLTEVYSHNIRRQLLLLAVGTALVLTTAYATLLQLNAAKVAMRWRELAMRACLGATHRRLFSQLLTEQLFVAIPAGLVGVAGATAVLRAIRNIPFGAIHPGADLRLTPVAVATGLALATVGAAATLRSSPSLGISALAAVASASTYRATGNRTQRRRWHTLIASQAGLSFALVAAASLFLKDFVSLSRTNLGFKVRHLFMMEVPAVRNFAGDTRDVASDIQHVAETIPDVSAAAFSAGAPIYYSDPVTIEMTGRTGGQRSRGLAMLYATSAALQDALQLRLLRGRFFQPSDSVDSPGVAVVDELFVRHYCPSGDPLGQRVAVALAGEIISADIVGVVGHIGQYGPARMESEPQVYLPFCQLSANMARQRFSVAAHLLFRVAPGVEEQRVAEAVSAKVHELAPNAPTPIAEPMRDRVMLALNPQRVWLLVFAFCAAAALLIGICGTYGVSSAAVEGQQRSIAIRLALGASTWRIAQAICLPILRQVIIGATIAVPIAYVVDYAIADLLNLEHDPAFSCGIMAGVCVFSAALVACMTPARRGLRANIFATLNVA